jgi:hypothetical protein
MDDKLPFSFNREWLWMLFQEVMGENPERWGTLTVEVVMGRASEAFDVCFF